MLGWGAQRKRGSNIAGAVADLGPDFVGRSLARTTTTTYKLISGVKAI